MPPRSGHSLLNSLIGLILAWLLGLALYVHDVMSFVETAPKDASMADGIVVFTGGSARLEAGLDLLAANKAPRLLISGVDPRADGKDLIPPHHPARRKVNCCVTFGTYAADTWGNAREGAEWAKSHGMKNLLLVTSNYHMRRSLLEFHTAMPDVALVPFPLNPEQVKLSDWWDNPGTASLLIAQYNKLLLAYLRVPFHKIFGDEPAEPATAAKAS